jgi:hypothetical protein
MLGKYPKKMALAMLALLAILPTQSSAQSNTTVLYTASGQIIHMLSGWGINSILVQMSANVPVVNPAGCPSTDLYETNPTDPGAALNHSILLTAYMSHANLALIIQGCSTSGRPHIIGVSLPS